MKFGVLGSIEARRDGTALPLGGPKQRAVLAILLLEANRVVSRDRLIDRLWGERPPPTAARTLDNYVSRLRKVLGSERLVRRAPGYLVVVDDDELDLIRFERLLEVGRGELADGNASDATATLREALAIWRGSPLADLLYEPFAAEEVAKLEERRVIALEERLEADLALGRSSELVVELEELVRRHPLRERLLGHLMLAQYRAGRQTAALATYRAARVQLAEELGLEPGPGLQRLERQILQHDGDIAGPLRAAPAPARASRG